MQDRCNRMVAGCPLPRIRGRSLTLLGQSDPLRSAAEALDHVLLNPLEPCVRVGWGSASNPVFKCSLFYCLIPQTNPILSAEGVSHARLAYRREGLLTATEPPVASPGRIKLRGNSTMKGREVALLKPVFTAGRIRRAASKKERQCATRC